MGQNVCSTFISKNNYNLFPNPSTGIIAISQREVVNETATVRVMNYVGAIVYTGELVFAGGNSQLNLSNAIPGVYLIELINSKGNKEVFRLVIEK